MDASQRQALIAELRAATSLELVVWANRPNAATPDAKAPPLPYATIYVATSNTLHTSGRMNPIGSAAEDLMAMTSHVEDVITVAVFHELDHDARELVQLVQDHFKTPAARRALRGAGLVYVRREGPARDSSTFQDTTWEGRAELDIRLRRRRDWNVDAGVIEKANFQGDVDGRTFGFDADTTE